MFMHIFLLPLHYFLQYDNSYKFDVYKSKYIGSSVYTPSFTLMRCKSKLPPYVVWEIKTCIAHIKVKEHRNWDI